MFHEFQFIFVCYAGCGLYSTPHLNDPRAVAMEKGRMDDLISILAIAVMARPFLLLFAQGV